MANIILIETATATCSVALSCDGKVVAIEERTEQNIHAGQITLFIESVMKQSGLTFPDVDAVAVSRGPGSYTGLRIGVSTAKGLCYALDTPLIAVDTLHAMANGLRKFFGDELLCPMIDARRMEVYTAVFDTSLKQLQSTDAVILDSDTFSNFYSKHNLVLFGDGSAKAKLLFKDNDKVKFHDLANSASYLNALAVEKFDNADFEDTAYFEPYYLKEFIAGKPKQGQ